MIEVPVKALDEHTAFELARKRARQAIDTLNFFADLIPFNHGRVYLVPWDCTEPRASFSLSEKGDWYVSSEVTGQSIGYDMRFGRLSSYLSDAIARAEGLLVHADTLDSFSSVLLSSLLWAGRATTAQNLEEAFLLYAIALETLMLPEGNSQELRYRLALRVAYFLGDDYEQRRNMAERIRHLYGIRSKIVHSGSFQVSEHEVMSMRSIAKQAILRALHGPRLRACEKREDAAKWFEERVLGSQ